MNYKILGVFFIVAFFTIVRLAAILWGWEREVGVDFKDRPVSERRWCPPGEYFMWSHEHPGHGKCGKMFYDQKADD